MVRNIVFASIFLTVARLAAAATPCVPPSLSLDGDTRPQTCATTTSGSFGPGPNAPAWSGKIAHPVELFTSPIPYSGGANAAGFRGYQGFPENVSYPVVSTPLGNKPVLQVNFPQGQGGGYAPARFDSGNFPAGTRRVYTRVLFYADPTWTNGGNTGTKFFFYSQGNGNNHYTAILGESAIDETRAGVLVGLQGGMGTVTLRAGSGPANGQWWDVEYVFIANTPGSANGTAQVWINGVQYMNLNNVGYFASGQTAQFTQLFTDPTYGGGMNPAPRNIYFRIAAWYRESAP